MLEQLESAVGGHQHSQMTQNIHPPMKQPTPLYSNSISKPSMYIQNKIGDITPPCLTTLLALN